MPVSRILSCAVIPLDAALPRTFNSNLPGGFGTSSNRLSRIGPMRLAAWFYRHWRVPPYLVLLRVGFTLPAVLQQQRCALTAPFHPYPDAERASSFRETGNSCESRVAEAVFSLWHWPSRSLDAAIPDVIRHTALRSSDFPPPANSSRRNRQRPPSIPCSYDSISENKAANNPTRLGQMLLKAKNIPVVFQKVLCNTPVGIQKVAAR